MKEMKLQIFLLASTLAVVTGYPLVASNKRYGGWLPIRPHPPPSTYIDPYLPNTQEDLIDFYYQPSEPLRYYQLPYYYSVPEYYYDTNDEEEDLDQQQQQLPQQWYTGNNAEANAIFLQNLMLAQLYSRAAAAQNDVNNYGGEHLWSRIRDNNDFNNEEDDLIDPDDSGTFVYGEPVKSSNKLSKEDRDVRELKSLVENRWVDKRGEEGQEIINKLQTRQQRKPSAYDAIKKLLIQQQKKDSDNRQPHKRSYIPNEDSLVEQLGSLKKI